MTEEQNSLAIIKPAGGIADYQSARSTTLDFFKKQMKVDRDYGIIPGTKKPSLWQPGAEKLANLFGLTPTFTLVKEVEDFEKGFFYYKYRCTLTHFGTGKTVGDAERSCNSKEKKYANHSEWVNNRKVERKATVDELIQIINTMQSMAQKRALVAAVRTATMATEIFSEEDGGSDKTPARSTDPEIERRRVFALATKKLFSAGAERGFSVDEIKNSCYKKYNVDSVTKLTPEQLEERYESLIAKYQIVAKGETPLEIGKEAPPKDAGKPVAVAETVSGSQAAPASEVVEGEVVEEPKEVPFEPEVAVLTPTQAENKQLVQAFETGGHPVVVSKKVPEAV